MDLKVPKWLSTEMIFDKDLLQDNGNDDEDDLAFYFSFWLFFNPL